MSFKDMPRLIMAREVAKIIGVSRKSLYEWIQPGCGAFPPPTTEINSRAYWSEETVLGVKSGDIQRVNGIWQNVNTGEPIQWSRSRNYGYNPDPNEILRLKQRAAEIKRQIAA
jgi:predicted DNA-binding transcriptional regulator AlpA